MAFMLSIVTCMGWTENGMVLMEDEWKKGKVT